LLARMLDHASFRAATLTLVDTQAHARRFTERYGLDPKRAIVVPVGAQDPGPLAASPGRHDGGPLRVLYFGGFIPLHGIDVVLDAAELIGPSAGIEFALVGDGQEVDSVATRLARGALPHVRL